MKRSMRLTISNQMLYESWFDAKKGTLVRTTEALDRYGDAPAIRGWGQIEEQLRKRFPHRYGCVPSPSPELIDVSITDRCTVGCRYCYQDSTPKGEHASPELVPKLIKGLDHAPYQIAIGGGEPTSHPEFVSILKETRKLGTVPNYTTAGHIFKPEIIDATNRFCGGVAITYHRFKGLEWFKTTYQRWAEALTCQLNIHVIADKDAARSLDELAVFQSEIKRKLNVVLLAYYPDVGRASMDLIMTRRVYSNDLPSSIRNAIHRGMGIAFSEGLLPYFLSRPEIGVNTTFATRSEGVYSCYVDPRGFMWQSSFHAPREKPEDQSLFQVSPQKLWDELRAFCGGPYGESCYDCSERFRCATPHEFHYLTCAKASHNKLPLKVVAGDRLGRYDFIDDDDED